jgi:glycosyltransferase involved in cell wall biosynthesis
VIPNGIDTARFRPDRAARVAIRRELGIPEAAVVIGSVGRLAPEKNFKLLIRALGPLFTPELFLVLVGDGAERGELGTLAEKMGVSQYLRLTGARSDVPELLAAFDIFALSSLTEGLPLAVPEAMAVGLPVISTAVGGLPDVIEDGVTGYLVPPEDEAALRGRLEQLSKDRAQAQALGCFARSSALARYSSERMLRDYLALYAEVVLEQRQRRRPVQPKAGSRQQDRRRRADESSAPEHEAAE